MNRYTWLTYYLYCLTEPLPGDILKTDIKVLPEHRLVEILLYGDSNCNEIVNKLIIEATIAFI